MATIKVHIISTSSCFSKPRSAEQLVPSLIIKSMLVEWNSGTQGETLNVMLLYEKKESQR